MLNDIESKVDYLNFKIVADPVAAMIKQSGKKPISIGVSGNWGAGKSSMVQMIADSLKAGDNGAKYLIIDFNAWLYQGYEDARLALLQQVADKLGDLIKEKKTACTKFKEFLSRVNWFKLTIASLPVIAKAAIGTFALGPVGGMAGGLAALLGKLGEKAKSIQPDQVSATVESCAKQIPNLKEYWKEAADKSMPKEIEALRKSFAETLKELDIILVVVVDDLDRCLPDIALSTLEAMRLLLMVERTVFIIAADETMIRQAIRVRYGAADSDSNRETSYFDKLIQIPVKVPRPGSNEVKCYIMMLLAELAVQQGKIPEKVCLSAAEHLRAAIKKSWAGTIKRSILVNAFGTYATHMDDYIDIADQISGLMTTSSIGGNPRLIKRFLNDLLIRKAVAESQEMGISFTALLKLQLFERCAPIGAFDELAGMVVSSADGKVSALASWEKAIEKGEKPEGLPDKWQGKFIEQWLGLTPQLGDLDLRPYLYLSDGGNERSMPQNDLSPEGRRVLSALTAIKNPKFNDTLLGKLKQLDPSEIGTMFEKLKTRAATLQWSSVSLMQLFHIPKAYPAWGDAFVHVLGTMPPEKRDPSIIFYLNQETWASSLLAKWESDSATPKRTVKTIQAAREGKK